jgi:hypothetical protein
MQMKWKRLFGIVLRLFGILMTTPAVFFLFVFLFVNGIVVRSKGVSYPLIDPYRLREAATCIPFLVLGVGLFLWGNRMTRCKESRLDRRPGADDLGPV